MTRTMTPEVPRAVREATEHQAAAQAALAAALAAPVHAYLFAGPPGSGKRAAARAFAAELLADGAPDADDARRRALADPAPFVHLILITSEPAALLETVRSRCQPVRFAPLPEDAVRARLEELGLGSGEEERRAVA